MRNQTPFHDYIRLITRFDKYFNYFACLFSISIGLFFTYLLFFTDWYEISSAARSGSMPKWSVYLWSLYFILLGCILMPYIPKNLIVSFVPCSLELEERNLVIEQIVLEFDLNFIRSKGDFMEYAYKSNSFFIHIYSNDDGFYLYVKAWRGGLCDPWTMPKIRRKFSEFLEQKSIAQHS